MMKKILIIHTQSSLNSLSGKEALDLSLIFGAYEQEVSVLFYNQGVSQVIAHQDPELIKQKDYISTIKALDIYDIENVFVSESCLEELNLSNNEILPDVRRIGLDVISDLKANSDHVYVI